MREDALREAMDEAKVFLERGKAVLADKETMKYLSISGNGKTGALRRQSMELTRALARMRRA